MLVNTYISCQYHISSLAGCPSDVRATGLHDARRGCEMAGTFDRATRDALRDAVEVAIRTSQNPDRGVVIWVVAVDDGVFARSFRRQRGRWYLAAAADGRATLECDGRRLPVRVAPVESAAVIEAVSQAYLVKYAASPYAKEMVRPEALPTTLRLDPI
jgi:hypothetical protein